MDEKTITTISGIATTGIPAIVTLITYFKQRSENRKHAAKQSVLQMIMEDQFNWELFRKFPTNYGNIQNEYQIYHDNGGNGEVTKKVKEYNDWFKENEEEMLRYRNYSCGVRLVRDCSKNESCSIPTSTTQRSNREQISQLERRQYD